MNQSQIILTNLEIFHAIRLQNLKTEGQAFSFNLLLMKKLLLKSRTYKPQRQRSKMKFWQKLYKEVQIFPDIFLKLQFLYEIFVFASDLKFFDVNPAF